MPALPTTTEGTGLELVITQKLVREMGGEINFRSRAGLGSTFWFHFPLQIHCHAWVDPHRYDVLMHKRLVLIETNSSSAQATLELLADRPLEVSHYPDMDVLGGAQVDILLIGKPMTRRCHCLTCATTSCCRLAAMLAVLS